MKRSLVVLLSLLTLAVARPVAAGKPSVAILGLEVTDSGAANGGVDAKSTQFAAQLTEVLRQRAKIASGPFSLAAGSDKDLVEMKLLSGCDNEGNDCMAAIGAELVADRLIFGHVEKQAKGYQISLKLLDIATRKPIRSTTDLIPYGETTGAAIDGWGRTLYAKVTGASNQGTMIVKTNVDRGEVYLDGKVRGTVSGGTARITGLDAGDYKVEVAADCYLRTTAKASVEGGKDVMVSVDLAKNTMGDCGGKPVGPGTGGPGPGAGPGAGPGPGPGPGPGRQTGSISNTASPGRGARVMFWTTAAISAGAGGALGYIYFGKMGDASDKWEANGGDKTDDCAKSQFYSRQIGDSDTAARLTNRIDACDTGEKWASRTWIAGGVSAAAGAAALYFFYKGYVATPEAHGTERVVRRKSKPAVAVTPVVTARELGGVVQIEF